MRLGFAATALGLWANGAGDPDGSAYDIDFMSAWTLVGRGTPDSGVLVVTGEFRDAMGSETAASVGPRIGTLINTVNAFNDRGWVVRDAYWLQRFNDGKLRVLIGRADTSDYVGQQPMQNVNTMFVNRHLSANPTVPFPGHGPTVGVSYRPSDRFYVTGGVANAYNTTTESGFDTISDGDFFYSAEAGWTPQVEGMGAGRYSVMVWHIDARNENGFASPSDDGVTFVAGQQLSDRLQVWGRYAHAGGDDDEHSQPRAGRCRLQRPVRQSEQHERTRGVVRGATLERVPQRNGHRGIPADPVGALHAVERGIPGRLRSGQQSGRRPGRVALRPASSRILTGGRLV